MDIEKAIEYIKNDIECDKDTRDFLDENNSTRKQIEECIDAYETLLTAYEKEKEKNKKLDKENQGLFELYNFNDISLLTKILKDYKTTIEKQSKEIEELKKEVIHWKGDYHLLSRKIDVISKDKIKEILHLTDEECDSEEKILSLLETIWDEFNRLEDIEDIKVQVDYERVFNKGVKSVEDKIKAKIEEIKEETKTCNIYKHSKSCTNNCKEDCEYYDFIDILQSLLEEKEE